MKGPVSSKYPLNVEDLNPTGIKVVDAANFAAAQAFVLDGLRIGTGILAAHAGLCATESDFSRAV